MSNVKVQQYVEEQWSMLPPVIRDFARTTMGNFAQLTAWLTGDQSYFMTNYEAFQRNQRLIQEMRAAKEEMVRAKEDLVRAAAEKDRLFRETIDAKFQLFDNRVDIVQKFVDDCRVRLESLGAARGPGRAAARAGEGELGRGGQEGEVSGGSSQADAGPAPAEAAAPAPAPLAPSAPRRRASVVEPLQPGGGAAPGPPPAPPVQAPPAAQSADPERVSQLAGQVQGLEQRYGALMSEMYSRSDRGLRETGELREDVRALSRRLAEQGEQIGALQRALDASAARCTTLEAQLRLSGERADRGLAALEARVGALEAGLGGLDALSARADALDASLGGLSQRLDALSGHVAALSVRQDEGRSLTQEVDLRHTQRYNRLSEELQAQALEARELVTEVSGEVRRMADGMDAFSEDLTFQVNNVKNLVAGAHLFREYEIHRRKELETLAEDLREGHRDVPALLAPMELRLRRLEDLLLDHLAPRPGPQGPPSPRPRPASRAASLPAARAPPRPSSAAPWINLPG